MKGPKKQLKKAVIIARNEALLKAYGWREFTRGGWILDGNPDKELIESLLPKLSPKQKERQQKRSAERLLAFERKLEQIVQAAHA